MEKRNKRVSEAQWNILLDFLTRNPSLARSRSYNNSAQGRAISTRLWKKLAIVINAESSGTTKTPKEWSVYVSNYKSKIKKIVADSSGTEGGPASRGSLSLSEQESRFLAILRPGFGQTVPRMSVNPFQVKIEQPEDSASSCEYLPKPLQDNEIEITIEEAAQPLPPYDVPTPAPYVPPSASTPAEPKPDLPRRRRQAGYRSRPLAPLNDAQRVLAEVALQRAASDTAIANALQMIGQAVNRLADAATRMADAAERQSH